MITQRASKVNNLEYSIERKIKLSYNLKASFCSRQQSSIAAAALSSSGPGHWVLIPETRVQIPVASPFWKNLDSFKLH